MLLLFRSLLWGSVVEPPQQTGSHGIEANRYLTGYEVDRFSDFIIKPKVKKNDDDDYLIICMMQ